MAGKGHCCVLLLLPCPDGILCGLPYCPCCTAHPSRPGACCTQQKLAERSGCYGCGVSSVCFYSYSCITVRLALKASPGRGKLSQKVTDEGAGQQHDILDALHPAWRAPFPQRGKAFLLRQTFKQIKSGCCTKCCAAAALFVFPHPDKRKKAPRQPFPVSGVLSAYSLQLSLRYTAHGGDHSSM